jgi:uncharacterized protein (TIGR04255 family)
MPILPDETEFPRAPVIETVLGVQFEKIPRMTSGHLGLFWGTLDRSKWPNSKDTIPIDRVTEIPGGVQWLEGVIEFKTAEHETRLQIRSSDESRMIQLQNGWLVYNWLRGESQPYPRYSKVHSEFTPILQTFRDFLKHEELEPFRPDLWEVTYVNLIERGTVWKEYSELPAVFPGLVSRQGNGGIAKFEFAKGTWVFELPPSRGRLHVTMQPVRRAVGGTPQEFIQLKLTARGPINDEKGWTLESGHDLGHRAIVGSFVAFASSEALKYWKESGIVGHST